MNWNLNTIANNSPQQPPLAVVGLSALFPMAANAEEFWSNIRRGVDAITEVPDSHWNPEDYFDSNKNAPDMTYARRGGFLSPVPFDPLEFGISPNNLEAIDTSQLLGLVGAKRALEHAGYGAGRTFDRSRVGCILGVTGTLEMVIPLGARLGHPKWRKALQDAGVPDDVADDVVNRISESYVPWQENSFPGLLGNVVAGRIANRLDLHGTNCVADAACASSLSAMHLAALELWTGRSDMVVTGGIDTFNDIFMFMCFSKTPALSPSGDSKPFSEDADGTILGEGVGIVVLKRLADAERDGDRIYAVIKGIGTSSDGAGNAVYAPKADGQIRCLQDAYRVSGVSPDTIELVEAHGTGTKVGDATEVSGLMHVYKSTGRPGAWCASGSIKSQIGHTKAAAGAAGVLKAVLALQHKVLPPTIKVKQPPAALLADDSPFYVCTEARPWVKPVGHPRRAAVSAFGFGGSNFHCVLEESPQSFDEPDWDGDVQVVALSALSLNELAESVREFSSHADWPSVRKAARSSRAAFREQHPHRLLLVIERDKTDIAKLVDGALSMLDKYADRASWSTPDGAHYGRGAKAGALAVLFPGQGSQYVGMLRELALRFPTMNAVLSEANEVFASTTGMVGNAHPTRLSDFIYPVPSWTDEARTKKDSELRATQIAQPAIGAVSLGALAILEQFGVRAEAAAGHSYGELTALCASRRFAPKALYRLSMLRGRLMAEAQEVDGGMLAIGAPLTQVEAAIKEMAVDLVVANHNSPNQVVLSGRLPEIDRASALFSQRNLRGKKLQVAAAFHSPLVAGASRAFRPELDDIEFAPSQMPVYANTTATQYPTDARAARDLLAAQLARPVNFVREVEQMHADGVRTFVEVGPGGVLTGLVNSILSGRDFRAVALDSSNGRRNGLFDLASALAQLSASGHSVNWTNWDPASRPVETSGPSNRLRIPICGANYVKPRTPIPPRPPMVSAPQPTAFGQTSTFEPPVQPVDTPTHVVPPKSRTLEPASHPQAAPVQPAPGPAAFARNDDLSSADPYSMLGWNDAASRSTPSVTTPAMNHQDARNTTAESLAAIEENLRTLQRMQEETARLHQRFLEGQEAALRTFELLAQRQLELSGVGGGKAEGGVRKEERGVDSGQWAVDRKAEVTVLPIPSVVPQPSFVSPAPAVPSTQYSVPATSSVVATPSAFVPPPVVAMPPVIERPSAPATPSAVVSPSPAANPPTPSSPPIPSSPLRAPSSALASTVLAVVSEKTGYPTEMLNLGMSLDHDLGIDSIKRVEILSALQERVPNLPAFKPEELGALHTLNDVVNLAEARSGEVVDGGQWAVDGKTDTSVASAPMLAPQLAGVGSEQRMVDRKASTDAVTAAAINHQSSTISPAPSSPHRAPSSALSSTVLAVVSEKTGYPTEMLNLEMSLDHDLGIDSIKRVEILSALQERVPNLPAFNPEELGALHTLNDVVSLADARMSGTKQEAPLTPTLSPQSRAEGIGETSRIATEAARITATVPVPAINDQPSTINPAPSSPLRVPSPALSSTVLAVVSEKTGYPTEMLNLDMSLDHDLGIDSIKRVEILSALQERVPNLPAFKPEELGALHTLNDVVSLAEARSAECGVRSDEWGADSGQSTVAGKPATNIAVAPSLAPQPSSPSVVDSGRWMVDRKSEASAVATASLAPQPSVLRPAPRSAQEPLVPIGALNNVVRSVVQPVPLARSQSRVPLGLPLGSEIWITEDGLELSLRIASELSRRGYRPRVVNMEEAATATVPESVAGLIAIAPADGMTDVHLWHALEWFQKLSPQLQRTAQRSPVLLATVSRLDGRFGFKAERPLHDPVSGGLAGLIKSAAREWPEITCRSFDLSSDWPSTSEAASVFVDELLRIGPVETGLSPQGTWLLDVVEEPFAATGNDRPPVQPGDLIVITGGARGVTATCAEWMAKVWRPRLAILGRTGLSQQEPDWLVPLRTEAEIKQGLLAHGPGNVSPRELDGQFKQIMAEREAIQLLNRLRATGVDVSYHAVDVRDAGSVRHLMNGLRREYGPIRGLIHGAGVLADQRIETKTRDQFERVYQTKVLGLRNLISGIAADELRLLGLFSSYTARYGRIGQSDYAIANEVLNKMARQFAVQHPRTHVASFNWGPWDGGMVTGGLKQLFASEGVGLIPPDEGARLLLREFSRAAINPPVEVLVLGRTPGPQREHAATPESARGPSAPQLSGGDPLSVTDQGANRKPQPGSSNVLLSGFHNANERANPVPGPGGSSVFAEIGQLSAPEAFDAKTAFERTLSLEGHPYLESHVIGGRAVLPVAMIVEWLAHAAIHANPGLELLGINDLRVYQGVRLSRTESVRLKVVTQKATRSDGRFLSRVQLLGTANGREVLHAGGQVVLATGYPQITSATLHVTPRGYPLDVASAYEKHLFHGPALQGIASVEACSDDGIIVDARTATPPWAWLREPLRQSWLADPLALDAALQAVILWCQQYRHQPCLPCAVARYQQFRRAFPKEGVRIVVGITHSTHNMIRCDIEMLDQQGQIVARMEGCESVTDESLATAFQHRRVVAGDKTT